MKRNGFTILHTIPQLVWDWGVVVIDRAWLSWCVCYAYDSEMENQHVIILCHANLWIHGLE